MGYGRVNWVSVDTTYGVVCYATSRDSIVHLSDNKPLTCVYSPEAKK